MSVSIHFITRQNLQSPSLLKKRDTNYFSKRRPANSSSSSSMSPPPFLLIPLMAPGHIIPLIDMAKLLAGRGSHVSIVVTPLNAARFESVVSRAASSGLSIRLLRVEFPGERVGLPSGSDSADKLPSYSLVKKFFQALILMEEPVENLIRNMDPFPGCIIGDKHIPWIIAVSEKLEVPTILFDGMSCFTQMVAHSVDRSKIHEQVEPDEYFAVSDVGEEVVEFTRRQLPGFFNPGPDDFTAVRRQIRESELRAYGMAVNTFEELEKRYVDEFRSLKKGKVWAVGPFCLCTDDDLDRAERGDRASIAVDRCMKWLDQREANSVIYACLGSLGRISPLQFRELASGLELSGRPFVVVVKGVELMPEIEEWIESDGVEERTKDRGLFIRGWAPQVLILSHPSIAGFVTHCGWNSTLEGICAGVPMATWPLFGEQFLNEKLVVQILRIGVPVGAKEVVHLGEVEKSKTNVNREMIKDAIEKVMEEGGEGKERRRRVEELKRAAKIAVEAGGSSHRNVSLLIQEIEDLMKTKKTSISMAAIKL